MNSITRRWIKGSLLITIVLLIAIEVLMVTFVRNSYYSSVTTALLNRINTINGILTASTKQTALEKEQMLFRMTEEFSEKDKFELMVLNSQGMILATSSGFKPMGNRHEEDFALCQQNSEGIYTGVYKTLMNENVLSATALLKEPAKDIYAVRLVTSLTRVDNELNVIYGFTAIAILAIVAFSIISGMYFISSIVIPIQGIKESANKISHGEFDIRIENKYNDEIGELCNTINNMAQELGKSDELKNEFISSVSHELRTPLTAIKGWAETLQSTADENTVQKGTQVILGETERLYTMVENLLDFSRIQQAPLALTKEKLDLVAEVGEAVIMFLPRAHQSGMEIIFNEPDIIIPVMADKNRLKQVLVNLLDNSIKYSEKGGIIEVNLSLNSQKAKAEIEVKDYGKGILPEDIEKVKEKFYKGKGAKRGSGIGLALVNEIVKAHGGQFIIKSEYAKYTSMRVVLNTVRTMKGK